MSEKEDQVAQSRGMGGCNLGNAQKKFFMRGLPLLFWFARMHLNVWHTCVHWATPLYKWIGKCFKINFSSSWICPFHALTSQMLACLKKMWGNVVLSELLVILLELPMRSSVKIVLVFATTLLILLFFANNLQTDLLPATGRIGHILREEEMRKVEEDFAHRRQNLQTSCRRWRRHLPREKKHLGHLRYSHQPPIIRISFCCCFADDAQTLFVSLV